MSAPTRQITRLDNGLTVLTDRMASVESVSLGVWIGVGTRHETAAHGGVAHLLKKNKVAVCNGSGRLDGTAGARRKVKVAAGDKTVADLTAAHVILASGARARTLPGIEADGKTP